jgi:predicted kinase
VSDLATLIPIPAPGDSVNVDAVFAAAATSLGFDTAAMHNCDQSPLHHAEGDALTHTTMALEALVVDPAWRALDEPARAEVFVTTLLHDAAKPRTSTIEDDVIRHPGHAHRGEKLARAALWRAAVAPVVRERVAQSIRYHLHPFFIVERPHPVRNVLTIAQVLPTEHLVLLARADINGRVCADSGEMLASVDLFEQLGSELGCLDKPYPFASDHSRFEYFTADPDANRDPAYGAYEDPDSFSVTVMSGLPGSGKSTWAAANAKGRSILSLDDLRTELKLSPSQNQRPVIVLARERARELLRARQEFIWDATNLSRSSRTELTTLLANYGARIHIVATEAPYDTIIKRNKTREASDRVPAHVIAKMIDRWEAPTTTECHTLEIV